MAFRRLAAICDAAADAIQEHDADADADADADGGSLPEGVG
jgi:hypothetical protein